MTLSFTSRPSAISDARRSAGRVGTVLMECVIVLPILLLLIFAIAQFALIWYAQIMVNYAAYNAARAALVYNPAEYSRNGSFYPHRGPCWEAAVKSLAWVSASPGDAEETSFWNIPGWKPVPNSRSITNQVEIISSRSFESRDKAYVQVGVAFYCPVHVPVVGKLFSKMDTRKNKVNLGFDAIVLESVVVAPKPWDTSRYPRRP